MKILPHLAVFVLLCNFAADCGADDEPQTKPTSPASDGAADKTTDAPKDTATLTVKAEPLKVEIAVDGVFEATKSEEVILRPDAWSEFTVISAVPHGKRVKKGTALIQFDPQKLGDAIEALERTEAASKLAVRQAEVALQIAEKSVPQALAAAQRSAANAAEDLDYFEKIGRKEAISEARMNLESASNSLAYQREELRQLEKMYAADDLTEETEEIILTRARNRLKVYEHLYKRAELDHEKFMKQGLPRQATGIQNLATTSSIALQEVQFALPASLIEKTLALEKLKVGLQETREKLADLKSDQSLMTVRAPADGIVYYGQSNRGTWPEVATLSKMLQRGGAAKTNQVLMTIVDNQHLAVRTTIDENNLHEVSNGAAATVTPKAYPDTSLGAKLKNVGLVPYSDGKFDAVIALGKDTLPTRLAAGMNCKAKIIAYHNQNAIMVPKSAVADPDAKSSYVYIKTDDGNKKRNIKVGRTQKDRLEIVRGLKAGDTILVGNPDNKSTGKNGS